MGQSIVVEAELGHNPFSGDLYLFINRERCQVQQRRYAGVYKCKRVMGTFVYIVTLHYIPSVLWFCHAADWLNKLQACSFVSLLYLFLLVAMSLRESIPWGSL